MKYKIKIRFGDTDAYGIVHHRNYYQYFEEARFLFSRDIFGFEGDTDIKFPLIESYCKYRNPIKFSLANYIVEIRCENIMHSKLEFEYTLMDELCKKVYAYGKTVHVYIDEHNKFCLELPEWLIKRIEEYNS